MVLKSDLLAVMRRAAGITSEAGNEDKVVKVQSLAATQMEPRLSETARPNPPIMRSRSHRRLDLRRLPKHLLLDPSLIDPVGHRDGLSCESWESFRRIGRICNDFDLTRFMRDGLFTCWCDLHEGYWKVLDRPSAFLHREGLSLDHSSSM